MDVTGERLLDINPGLNLKKISTYLKDDFEDQVLDKPFDYIVDAIDTLSPKVFLIFQKPIAANMF
ncbi:MAG: tRNA threonylcarbamoyladenosine dehydratase, partial [Bacteroidales bacterium]|nr:tRNA threonylcarbamoyladenosine dehydratase [Bacteroidales bacterium]